MQVFYLVFTKFDVCDHVYKGVDTIIKVGGLGSNGARSVQKFFYPVVSKTLKYALKSAFCLIVHAFFGYATIITLCFKLMTSRIWFAMPIV